jgi:hypothetical protein
MGPDVAASTGGDARVSCTFGFFAAAQMREQRSTSHNKTVCAARRFRAAWSAYTLSSIGERVECGHMPSLI